MITLMNEKVFYDAIKKSHFGGKLGQKQFEGVDAILKEGTRRDLPINQLAYILATPSIETGNTYQPIVEKGSKSYFNKYDIKYNPAKAKVLGNTSPGDGYKYRGRGDVQTTGKGNYLKFRDEVMQKFGVDIVENPDAILGNMPLSVYLMFEGMLRGVYTGKKLSDYLTATRSDYYNARRTVNGLDRAKELSDTAKKFEAALRAAGYGDKTGESVEADPMLDGMLYLGDRGEAVRSYGTDINYLGFGPLTGDIYDPSFISATRKFQKSEDLIIDGKAGPETLARVALRVKEKTHAMGLAIEAVEDSVNGDTTTSQASTSTIPVSTMSESPYLQDEEEPKKRGKGWILMILIILIAGIFTLMEPIREVVVGFFTQ